MDKCLQNVPVRVTFLASRPRSLNEIDEATYTTNVGKQEALGDTK